MYDRGGVFQVRTNEGIMEFNPSAQGLHYHDVSDASSNIELMLVNTVRENFEAYAPRSHEGNGSMTHSRNDCKSHQKGVCWDGA